MLSVKKAVRIEFACFLRSQCPNFITNHTASNIFITAGMVWLNTPAALRIVAERAVATAHTKVSALICRDAKMRFRDGKPAF